MAIPSIQTAFTAGEIAPALFGHVDLAKFHIGAATARNAYVNYRGGLSSRAGTAYVGRSKQPHGFSPPRVIPFQFSINQGYCLEFGDRYMRVYANGAPVTETPFSIEAVSNTNPAVFEVPGSNFANGDWVVIAGAQGMTQINGLVGIVANAWTDLFTLFTLAEINVDTVGLPAYTGGGTVARIYTLATPYAAADLPWLKYTQSADVMSLCCVNQVTGAEYPPYDLARIAADNWTLTELTFAAGISAPATCSVSATVQPSTATSPPTLPAAYAYVATAVSDGGEESIASPIGSVTNGVDIAATAGSNVITYGAVSLAVTYNIYRAPVSYNTQPGSTTDALPVPAGALFGYIGQSYGTQFVDSNITPDYAQVPPTHQDPFAPGQVLGLNMTGGGSGITSCSVSITSSTGAGFVGEAVVVGGVVEAVIVRDAGQNYKATDTVVFTVNSGAAAPTATLSIGPATGTYPSAVGYFAQRRVYAGSLNDPDTYWMSKPGAYLNFDTSIPTTSADAITGTPWSVQVNGVQWLIPMPGGLVVLTGRGAWQVTGAGSTAQNPQPITPTSQQAQPQAFNGASPIVPPFAVNYDIIYVQSKGSIVRDLAYNYWINIYTGTDLTILSSHLFTGYQMINAAWCEEPHKVGWFVRNDGTLLSLTYLKEQEVYGWARHDTLGQFLSVCSVTELPVDALYAVVQRPIESAGNLPYFIERMDNRLWQTVEDPWCVDCGLALPMGTRAATLNATTVSGQTILQASASVFTQADVGAVVRIGGGIAYVTHLLSASDLQAEWVQSPGDLLPDNVGAPGSVPQPAPSGEWTITQPVIEISGLSHLAGATVTGLADGVPLAPQVVSNAGTIKLPFYASDVKVGLPFQVQVQSVYLDPGAQPTMQGRRKDITAVTARVAASYGVQIGSNQPDGSTLSPPAIAPAWSNMTPSLDNGGTYTSPGAAQVAKLFTGDIRINVATGWDKRGQAALQQDLPLPLNVTALIPEWLAGDLPEQTYQQAPQQRGTPPAPWQPPSGTETPRGPGPWMLR